MSQSKQSRYRPSDFIDVGRVIQFINRRKDGWATVEMLISGLKFSTSEHVLSFVLGNEYHFVINKKNGPLSFEERIWVKTSLKLCAQHCRKNQICDGTCGCLHVCRNYLLRGSEFCSFNRGKKKCMFGHNLMDDHNKSLLKAHNLHYLDGRELQMLFRRRTCRSFSTMPQVCLYYNDRRGNRCSNKNCTSLHFCIDQLRHMCIGTCHRDHDLSSARNKSVLTTYAISLDEAWTEELLLEDLETVMEHRKTSDMDSVYTDSHCDSDDLSDGGSENDGASFNGIMATQSSRSYSNLRVSQKPLKPSADNAGCTECVETKELVQKMMLKIFNLEKDVRELQNALQFPRKK